ncbi:SPFH domain-containing protein [Paenibacillus sp. PAMC21692]|uniref:SPFH domain-containing protein n=1 Tax=Paenibacillus sp. PAMC21692 TaxID=2762320 RepID=UPI00164D6F6C|nr:SPFH domain-containing protein [Paenibacillus sp. PAMC21692]QNK57313.1 SPFH domain-containing protein [Paenibacillus sp. PAMC21692]
MVFFKNQFANVVEWEEFRDDMIFWKWSNKEIKKGSKLIIRPGQDAIFVHNGRIEGIFQDEGDYNIDSQIIPFLSTLKGFKFGFNSGMRVEVVFVNTKEFTVRWGTQNPVMIPTPQLPGGMPIRANGTFVFKVKDYVTFIDKIAGVRESYLVDDVKLRITSVLDSLLMKWISTEGKDMFNLQANAAEISRGIREDLDMELLDIGITISGFQVMSFNYPPEIQAMITKNASHSMIGDMGRYQQASMIDAISSGKLQSGGMAADAAGMMMGMNIAKEMMKGMNGDGGQQGGNGGGSGQQGSSNASGQQGSGSAPSGGGKPNFCPNCGAKNEGANFCPNCGQKLG